MDYLSRNPVPNVNQISKPRNWAQIAQAADNETQDLVQKLQDGILDSTQYVVQNDVLYYKYTPVGEVSAFSEYFTMSMSISALKRH